MDVSKNSGTPKSSNFNRVFHYKPSILGYPSCWKHPSLTSGKSQTIMNSKVPGCMGVVWMIYASTLGGYLASVTSEQWKNKNGLFCCIYGDTFLLICYKVYNSHSIGIPINHMS